MISISRSRLSELSLLARNAGRHRCPNREGAHPAQALAAGRVAGRSFAMAHATEEVKAAATEHLRADVTTGGGVAEAAERAGLL